MHARWRPVLTMVLACGCMTGSEPRPGGPRLLQMRHRSAGGLPPVEPPRKDGALAHAWPARDDDPSRVVRPEQPRVEPRQHVLAPDEPPMSPSLGREIDQLRRRW
jgi:hypothetical protein